MANASEQFRQSDVTAWGVVTLVCAGLAVFGANLSMLLPQSVLGKLHQPRVSGASIETLRLQVSDLTEETLRLTRENEVLLNRFTLQERSGNDITRRVGALEVSVPRLLEDIPPSTLVDMASQTATIGANETLTFDAPGGSVAIRQSAMPEALSVLPSIESQPLPQPIEQVATAPQSFGVALGAAVPADGAPALWDDLTAKLGPLLFGLTPLVTAADNGQAARVVAGPIADRADANALCSQLQAVSIACAPVPYDGTPL